MLGNEQGICEFQLYRVWGSYPLLELLLKCHREGFQVGSTGIKLVRNQGGGGSLAARRI